MKVIGAFTERFLPHSAEKVAKIVGSPALIVNWHPWVERVHIFEEQGFLFRKSVLFGGESELIEKYWDAEGELEFRFQAVRGLWAECRYCSRVKIEACEEGCRVEWEGRLIAETEEDESEQMEAFYAEGLRGLADFLDEL